MTIQKKVWLIVAVALIAIVINGVFVNWLLFNFFSELNQEAKTSYKKEEALLEMEVNINEANRALNDFLRDFEPRHLEKLEDSFLDFESYYLQFLGLAVKEKTKSYGKRIYLLFDEIKNQIKIIIDLEKEGGLQTQRLRANLRVVEGVIEKELEKFGVGGAAETNKNKRMLLQKLENNLDKVILQIEKFLANPGPNLIKALKHSENEFEEFKIVYLKGGVTRTEKEWVEIILNSIKQLVQTGQNLLEKTNKIQKEYEILDQKMDDIDNLFDEEAQPLVQKEILDANDKSKGFTEEIVLLTSGVTFAVFLLVGSFTGIFARNIVKKILYLIHGAEEYGRGNLNYRLKSVRNDELGRLARVFNDMANKLSESQNSLVIARDELEKKFQDQKAIIDSIHSELAVISNTGNIEMVNKLWEKSALESWTPNYWSNSKKGSYFFDQQYSDPKGVFDNLKEALENKRDYFSCEVSSLYGEENRIFLLQAALLQRSKGGMAISFTDITEQKKTEENLVEREHQLSGILENAPAIIFLRDLAGRFLLINKMYEDLLGVKNEHVKGKILNDVFDITLAKQMAQNDERVLESMDPLSIEEKIDSRKGPLTILSVYFPLLDENGTAYAVCGISTDITDRKRAEKQLEVYKNSLEEMIDSRTQELKESNLLLQKEIEDRKKIEANLVNREGQLRNLSNRLQTVREDEKKRIAREIHDELGQMITASKLDLVWVKKNLKDPPKEIKERLTTMLSFLDNSLNRAREISSRLRPQILDVLGLFHAMEWQVRQFEERNSIQCKINLHSGPSQIDPDISTELFRIFQEILTNVSRHSKATKVEIDLIVDEEKIIFEASDDGVGFDESKIDYQHSLGLLGMRERVFGLDGEIEIKSTPGEGVSISVVINQKN